MATMLAPQTRDAYALLEAFDQALMADSELKAWAEASRDARDDAAQALRSCGDRDSFLSLPVQGISALSPDRFRRAGILLRPRCLATNRGHWPATGLKPWCLPTLLPVPVSVEILEVPCAPRVGRKPSWLRSAEMRHRRSSPSACS